tara:strand:+ start:568 stop:792 length:225 start_codon:yes stop_codon:yes gene_type:complete
MKITRRQLRQLIKEQAMGEITESQSELNMVVQGLADLLATTPYASLNDEAKAAVANDINWLIENLPTYKQDMGI